MALLLFCHLLCQEFGHRVGRFLPEELQKKLEAAKGRPAAVEEKLTEGAVSAVEHVVGVIKSRQPDFDPNLILQGYNCSQADDVQQLLDGIRPMAVAFVEKLGFSIDDDDEDGE